MVTTSNPLRAGRLFPMHSLDGHPAHVLVAPQVGQVDVHQIIVVVSFERSVATRGVNLQSHCVKPSDDGQRIGIMANKKQRITGMELPVCIAYASLEASGGRVKMHVGVNLPLPEHCWRQQWRHVKDSMQPGNYETGVVPNG